jgi:hypothetical protein
LTRSEPGRGTCRSAMLLSLIEPSANHSGQPPITLIMGGPQPRHLRRILPDSHLEIAAYACCAFRRHRAQLKPAAASS